MSDLSSQLTPKTKALSVIVIVAVIIVLTVVVNFPSSKSPTKQAEEEAINKNEQVIDAKAE